VAKLEQNGGGGVQDDGGALFWPDGGAKCGKKLLIITEIHFSVHPPYPPAST
jgi:hypothetical protein